MRERSGVGWLWLLGVACALLGLPLLGVVAAGEPVGKYAEFPPLTQYVEHAAFSWWIFVVLAVAILAVLAPIGICIAVSLRLPRRTDMTRYPFPWWGWVALGVGILSWIVAWTRIPLLGSVQHLTFIPLWLAYVVVVNALTFRRTGRCMLMARPLFFAALFPASGVFWWFFEYLNRFVQNWYYVGAEDFSPPVYAFLGTLSFSTVLPAVLSTHDLIDSLPAMQNAFDRFVVLPIRPRKMGAAVAIILSSLSLFAIGIWPDYLFPMLWVSPLVLLTSAQVLAGRKTVFAEIGHGDWRRVVLMGLAALICGFFWEMWNLYSMPKWVYCVPFVNRFRIFEMPVLGFSGYLPFGLECAVAADLLQHLLAAIPVRKEGRGP